MTHTALARKYRPTRFAELVAQDHVAAGLSGAVVKNRVAHGYLLTGPRGVGKTTAARILAMALNCVNADRETGEPCGTCESCQRIWSGAANLDVVEIDAASHRGVDDARDLRERAMYAASGPDRYKVYIVDEAHMLTREAWNALLKILEEPPPRVVFVFATTEPQKIANTTTAVLSRLHRFDFRSIGPKAVEARLREVAAQENIQVEDDAFVLISRVANGAMRDALSVLDQVLVFGDTAVSAARVREALGLIDDELYGEMLAIVAGRRSAEVFPFVAKVVERGADLAEFVNGVGETLRAVAVTLLGGEAQGLTDALQRVVAQIAQEFGPGDIMRMLAALGEVETNIRRSANPRLQVETLLLEWTMLDRTVALDDIIGLVTGQGGEAGRVTREPEGGTPATTSDRGRAARAQSSRQRPSRAASPNPTPTAHERASDPGPAGGSVEAAVQGPIETLPALEAAWPKVVDLVSAESPLVGGLLANTRPTALTADGVEIAAPAELEGLKRKRALIQRALGTVMARTVQVSWATAGGSDVGDNGGESRKRRTVGDDMETRLAAYRRADPTLDAMVDALDLELTE